jgi:hypothetical protein
MIDGSAVAGSTSVHDEVALYVTARVLHAQQQ